MKIAIFPGKNTPLKRYKSYFTNIELYIPTQHDKPNIVLCHSLGYKHAIEFCINNNIYPKIVVMDGVVLEQDVSDLDIVFFCPYDKQPPLVKRVIIYEVAELKHYPYMHKNIRNKIIKELLN